ncbi:MAG: hypothetical protein AUG44_14685 [Actinobacteria bacterium 13_1_20CM_3_71_11]|nr:MAG: hypothetical protein AUG44_14685 [Actinobacteria bacterium 13_1_20CM_3_71_11]
MTDPTIASVLQADVDLDPHWVAENIEFGHERLVRIPGRYRDAVVTVPEVKTWLAQLVMESAIQAGPNRPPRIAVGRSLLILGPVGTGKTFEAYGAIRALLVSGASCSWICAPAADIYAAMRPRSGSDPEAVFEKYAHIQFLVVDDLGAAKNSEWVEEINYRLVNYRYERELPTLITSNLPPKNLAAELGERVASRLVEMCDRVVLEGPDRRRAA